MKLKRVELQGFKSFADRTVLEFDAGITAILGPNGCGKSNIVDAIRWVLGEQSAKQLRGAKMEDIIFKGTSKRKPVGLCEVSLVFTNEDRGLPIEFDEVSIKRRVTRDGFSQYYLNNSPVRLKDLRDLFFDSGINNTAYSVIEQEKSSRVLSENTQEIRLLIEEGAGIIKYKVRRKEAQRKLDHTEQDLLRLRDLVEVIGREVRSLQRQVGKARRYQKLYKQIRSLDLLIAGRNRQMIEGREAELRELISGLTVGAEENAGELAELRAKVEATRPAVEEREAERHGLEGSLNAFQDEMKSVEQKVLLSEHRIKDHRQRMEENSDSIAEICRRRETLHEEIRGLNERKRVVETDSESLTSELLRLEEELRLVEERFTEDRTALENASQRNIEFIESDNRRQGELREIQVRLENRRDRLQGLDGERVRLEETRVRETGRLETQARLREELTGVRRDLLGALLEIEKELQEAQEKRKSGDEEITMRRARLESLESRRDLLRKIKESWHGFSLAAQRILQKQDRDPGIIGSLADSLHVDERWSEAIEMLLGELLDSVVVSGTDKAVELVGEARSAEKGRVNILLAGGPESAEASGEPPAGGVRASTIVDGSGAGNPHIRDILARTWLFETDADAEAAVAAHTGTRTMICLSRNGLLLSTDGIVRGGRGKSQEVSLLGRGEKLEELDREIAEAAGRIESMKGDRAGNEELISTLTARAQQGREDLDRLNADLSKTHVEEAEINSRIESARDRLEAIARDREEMEASLAELAQKEAQLSATLDESGKRRDSSSMRVDELRGTVVSGEKQRDGMRRTIGEKRLLHSQLQGEKRELGAALAHRQETLAELTASEERLKQEIEIGEKELVSLGEQVARQREKVESGTLELERRRLLVTAAADAISTLHEETAVWHDRIKEIEDSRAAAREEIHKHETELATLDVRSANLVERIEEQYKGRFRELMRSIDPQTLPKDLEFDGEVFQIDQAQSLLDDARRKISSLGAVNHLAVEEYEQKSERLGFLETQLADVEKAKTDLISTIQKINTTARKLFHETFEEVRRNYIAVFETLFEGGHADLELMRTDDPLESNIQILAQPKGKRVDNIRLLSGGERCLTALSILFAVYLVKPSPFCLLDEADAPLDDANVERFVAMLRQFSKGTQFLVVTHNKLTMETANHLYGVTMMEQGVSSLVSVTFDDVASFKSDEELGMAIADRRRNVDVHEAEKSVLAGDVAEILATGSESRFTLGDAGGAGDPEDDAPADETGETESGDPLTDERPDINVMEAE